MTAPFIVDAHVHTGYPNIFYCPEVGARDLLRRMDQLAIQCSVNLGSARNLLGASIDEMRSNALRVWEMRARRRTCSRPSSTTTCRRN